MTNATTPPNPAAPLATSPANGSAWAPSPSPGLLAAALAGLLGAGCGETPQGEPDPVACPDAGRGADAAAIDAAPPDAEPSPIISETVGTRTFASLAEECATRGGFIEIHASCSGVNSCAGFSYGDWDPGVLTEHTCAGLNGCNGLSCVVLPPDQGRTAQEILDLDLPETGPRSCKNCHASWSDTGPDTTVFKVFVAPGSGRTLDNWLDLPASAQARIVAFGKRGTFPDGTAYSHMAPYYKLLSRAEIERVVAYVRGEAGTPPTLQLATIKVTDP